ncbi:hypothetical protein LF1_56450 [Rubripirellula obstinata]|uniref:Uncharacterized protein n=1 Tax=Rubripirellula obstinata TaxID=406547 RepID=A0A5B1CCG1_9BACT|nr:hypothetical protein [Rubripirellula obstinata]KAA1257083.1 hypothetical protein LF1_56450 [Rubripirellula obstinata]
MSVAAEAKSVYESDFRERLEAENQGDFVAIEPESRKAYIAATFIEAAMAAKAAHPEKKSFVIRVGHEAAVHIGAATR